MSERIDMKAAFEEWYRRERVGFEGYMLAHHDGHYVNTVTEAAWCAWAAACMFLAGKGAFTVEVNAQLTDKGAAG